MQKRIKNIADIIASIVDGAVIGMKNWSDITVGASAIDDNKGGRMYVPERIFIR